MQCVFVTYCTNLSINFANDYFDWEMDRPSQQAAILREIQHRTTSGVGQKQDGASPTSSPSPPSFDEKLMSRASRVIHDGTFPPWIALAISIGIQALPLSLMVYSRRLDPLLNPSSTSTLSTPFKGLTLYLGLLSITLSHEYIAPPLRLHYRGSGEVTSCLLLSPVSALFGYMGCYTATQYSSRPISPTDLFHGPTSSSFGIDSTLWIMLGAMYFTAQARILVMHIHDINVDIRGGKITMVVRIGYLWAARMYVGLNVVGVSLWVWLITRLIEGRGMMLGGMAGTPEAIQAGSTWAVGVGIVLAYSIPIMVLATASLFASTLSGPESARPVTIIPQRELAKVVSLQMLATPIVLSIAIVLAGKT